MEEAPATIMIAELLTFAAGISFVWTNFVFSYSMILSVTGSFRDDGFVLVLSLDSSPRSARRCWRCRSVALNEA